MGIVSCSSDDGVTSVVCERSRNLAQWCVVVGHVRPVIFSSKCVVQWTTLRCPERVVYCNSCRMRSCRSLELHLDIFVIFFTRKYENYSGTVVMSMVYDRVYTLLSADCFVCNVG